MFFRLLKYDFRSMLKQFGLIWPAALVLAVVNSFTLSGMESTSRTGETVAGVAMIVYVAIMIAMFVTAVIFVIQRFYRGLLGDEGYLMHTLPVKSWELIASKLVCAVAVTFVSIVVAIVSILIICRPFLRTWDADFFEFFHWLWKNFDGNVFNAIVILVELVVLLLVGTAQSYLMLYLSMGIGHLFHKNRVAMSVAAYIAIQAGINTVFGFLGGVFNNPLTRMLEHLLWEADGWVDLHTAFWIMIAATGAVAAVYFFAANYILKNKLNLE